MLSLLMLPLLAIPQIDDETPRRPTASELQRTHQLMAGTWSIVSVVDDGERLGAELIRQKVAADGNVIIADRSLQIINPETGARKQWMFRLNLSRTPRRIDVITPDDRILRGVFKFEDDDLLLCVPHHDETKVADGFDAPSGSGLMLVRLKTVASSSAAQPVIGDVTIPVARTEDVAKPADDLPPPRRATEAEIRRQHDLLAGEWDILSITNNGEQYAPDLIRSKIAQNGRIHIGERGFYLTNPRTEVRKISNMRIDPSQTPHTIEITNQFDDVLKGIYEFDGDKLKVCVNKVDGDAAPTSFAAPAGSNRVLYLLKMASAPKQTTQTVAAPVAAPTPVPMPPPQPDKNQQVREMLVGSWMYTDRKGTVTTVFQSGGTFVSTRVANRKRLFEPNTVTSSGRWDYRDGILNASINRSNDPKLLNHAYVCRVQSIGENTMVASDLFGELQNFKRLR